MAEPQKYTWKSLVSVATGIVALFVLVQYVISPILYGKEIVNQIETNKSNINRIELKTESIKNDSEAAIQKHETNQDLHMPYKEMTDRFVTREEFKQLDKKIDQVKEDIINAIKAVNNSK